MRRCITFEVVSSGALELDYTRIRLLLFGARVPFLSPRFLSQKATQVP